MTAHVRREDGRLEHLAERGRLVAQMAEVTAQQVVEVMPPEHVHERDRVEVLEHRLVLVNLRDGCASVDLARGQTGPMHERGRTM